MLGLRFPTKWSIAIERSDRLSVDTGVIRERNMPDLVAHRPEASRFFRLARILGAAQAFALTDVGPDAPQALIDAIVLIQDCKGDFCVVWRCPSPAFEKVIERALALEGETEIMHVVEEGV